MTARERHRAEILARDPYACALSPKLTGWPGEDSDAGPCTRDVRPVLEADHILKVSALLRWQEQVRRFHADPTAGVERFLELTEEELTVDARNGWLLCHRHHHLKDDRLLVLEEEIILPEHFVDFVADYELRPLLERQLRPRAMPGSHHEPPGRARAPSRRIQRPGYPGAF